MANPTGRPASPKHEAFFQAMARQMQASCVLDPSLRNMDIMAVLGRMAGYCVAMCHPDERDLARELVIANIDQGCADVAEPGEPTAGHG